MRLYPCLQINETQKVTAPGAFLSEQADFMAKQDPTPLTTS
jgi:hypothetical protein